MIINSLKGKHILYQMLKLVKDSTMIVFLADFFFRTGTFESTPRELPGTTFEKPETLQSWMPWLRGS